MHHPNANQPLLGKLARLLVLALASAILVPAILTSAAWARQPDTSGEVIRQLLPHPTVAGARVELYWTLPDGEIPGKLPAPLFVHGHQYPDRPGAGFYLREGDLAHHAVAGFVAAAVSQPGYGRSDGPPDFCGPKSHQAVHAALAALRRHPRVDPERIVLIGRSRGAVVSGIVATQDHRLAGLVLSSGEYDLLDTFLGYGNGHPIQSGIKHNIILESGGSEAALKARSVLHAKEAIRAPTLILHGADDINTSATHARALGKRLRQAGTEVVEVIYPGTAHRLDAELASQDLEDFLDRFRATGLPGYRAEERGGTREGGRRRLRHGHRIHLPPHPALGADFEPGYFGPPSAPGARSGGHSQVAGASGPDRLADPICPADCPLSADLPTPSNLDGLGAVGLALRLALVRRPARLGLCASRLLGDA